MELPDRCWSPRRFQRLFCCAVKGRYGTSLKTVVHVFKKYTLFPATPHVPENLEPIHMVIPALQRVDFHA